MTRKLTLLLMALPVLCAMLAWSATAAAQSAGQARGEHAASAEPSPPMLRVPDHPVWIGTVRIPVRVIADDKPLASGRYRVRLTGKYAEDKAVGQSAQLERWVEFVQAGQVKGRAMAPVVPAAAAKDVAEGPVPARGTVRVERLRNDDYYRLWFNYQGDQVLVYLPTA